MWEQRVSSSTKQRKDRNFEIALPFKNENLELPSNKGQVLARLNSTKRRLLKDKKYYEEYNSFMNTMIEKKFAELVPENELSSETGKCWYLVHHGVYHPRKNKLRVVFDCSLKYKGTSLNDELLQGPDLTNCLVRQICSVKRSLSCFASSLASLQTGNGRCDR